MGVSTFGLGTPIASLAPNQAQWGLSYPGATAINPFAAQQPYGQSPLAIASAAPNPTVLHAFQQVQQNLQVLQNQLQHLTQLAYLQQQHLQQLQQIIQVIPAQLAQLQQIAQLVPQHMQQGQSFAPFAGTSGSPGLTPWASPQIFGGQPGYVM